MKTNIKKIYIAYMIVCVLFSAQPYGLAQSDLNSQTQAEVKFAPGEGPTYPVHPEFPETEGNTGGTDGSLAIVKVTDFDFGAPTIAHVAMLYDNTIFQPNIQIVDKRGADNGWKLKVSASRFSNGVSATLPGAEIHIADSRPNSVSVSNPPVQRVGAIIPADGSTVDLIEAGEGEGMGLWVMRWYPPGDNGTYVGLNIPAGSASIGTHTSIIDWVLEDSPV